MAELSVAVPHQLRAGRVALRPGPAEAPDQTDGSPRRVGGGSVRERAKVARWHAQLAIREQQFARQFRHLAPELDHQLDPPPHDQMAMARSSRSAACAATPRPCSRT